MEESLQMQELNDLLQTALAEYKIRGFEYAKAYKKYRILVAQELLKLRAEGMPVTIAYDIARGNEEVANAKEHELATEALYNSCKEAIAVYKLKIKILQAQIDKDYTNNVN